MNNKKPNKRWRMVADPKIQGWLCARVLAYWVGCQLTIAVTILAFTFLQDGSGGGSVDVWDLVIKSLIVSAIALPIVLYDLLSFSNRFVGPVHNIRRKMEQLARTGETTEILLRKGDFYPDLCKNLNEVQETMASFKRRANQQA
jgi:hypothetical protein